VDFQVFLPGPKAVFFWFEDGAVLEGEDVAGDVQLRADAVGDKDCQKAVSPPSLLVLGEAPPSRRGSFLASKRA